MTGIHRQPRWSVVMWSSTVCAALLQLMLASCERSDRPEAEDVEGAVQEAGRAVEKAGERLKEEAKDARAKGQAELDDAGDAIDERTDRLGDRLGDTKAEFVATARQRLTVMEGELARLEADAHTKGQEVGADLRDDKATLEAELRRMEEESEQAWVDGKDRFADMLGKLEKK